MTGIWHFAATRLVDGPNQFSGRVEVFNSNYHYTSGKYQVFAQQWGTLCDSGWNSTDANVVCHSLGYRATGATAHMGGTYGAGEGPIWANNVVCAGTEFYIPNCQIINRYGSSNTGAICNHTTDVGVTCLGINMYVYYSQLYYTSAYQIKTSCTIACLQL